MSKALLRPFLVFVTLAAGTSVLVAVGSAISSARSVADTFLGLVVLPVFLIMLAVRMARNARWRRTAIGFSMLLLTTSFLAGAVALGQLVLARSDGTAMPVALEGIARLRSGAGLGLCLAGVGWGLACAANILAPSTTAAQG